VSKQIPLYDVFPFLKQHTRLATDYTTARVLSAVVNQPKTNMDLTLRFDGPVPPYEISVLEEIISGEYGIKAVNIVASFERSHAPAAGNAQSSGGTNSTATGSNSASPLKKRSSSGTKGGSSSKQSKSAILGRATKTKPTPMGDVKLEDGNVTIRGEVFEVKSRYLDKSRSWLLDFNITDYTGSIHVFKFMREENASKVAGAIKKGIYITVSGTLGLSKYDSELTLDPKNIFLSEEERVVRADNAEKKRIELHLHTKMSAMDALTDIAEVIKKAAEWGHPAIAITDHGVAHSFPIAAQTARSLKGKIKVIYGIEGYFRNDELEPQTKGKKRRNSHIVILVKNQTGMKNLYELITKSHIEYFDGRPIIYKSILDQHREGLILGSACESGEVFKAILNTQLPREELHKIASYYDYLEIMPISNNNFMLYTEPPIAKSEDELRSFNKDIIDLGRELNKPVVATGDVHFLHPEHEVYRQILLTSKGFSDSTSNNPLYFRTTDEMLEEFSCHGKDIAYDVVIKNPRIVADMCENVDPLPTTGQLYPPKLENSAENLKKIVYDTAVELYGENTPEIVTERIEYELYDILRLNYDVIYMAAQKLVAFLKVQGSRVGSRGSVGSSLVAHLAGITEVNPLPAHYRCPSCKKSEFIPTASCGADMPGKECDCGVAFTKDGFNIPFETFMGFDGNKVPDIDLNISSEHQNLAHRFTTEMFGSEFVYRAGTIGTVKEKNAYRFVKSYLEKIGKYATRAEENRLIHGCLGVKQTTGQHPGGLIIIPQDLALTDFCPAHYPADDKDKGTITLHYEYKYIEDNLIKLDILGHENPTMLRMLENMTGIDADNITLDDPETMSLFSSPDQLGLIEEDDAIIGETGSIAIPEFGTPFTRRMLCDTQPGNFDMLVRLSGFSHGESVWEGNAKELIITGTATVEEAVSSRDDIMLYLIRQGMNDRDAFKVSESVRKGRGVPKGLDEQMAELGVPAWYIDSCNAIKYLFPKAHAVAYVMIAFRIAWFKVHRPLEFYSAHFYRRRKNFDASIMTRGIDVVRNKIRELQQMNEQRTGKDSETLTTLEACYEYYMRGFDFASIDLYESDAEKFLILDDKSLRPPFVAVAGLGETAAQDLATNREGREFISIDDISAACPKMNKTNLDKLKQLGALRDLPDSSQMSLF